MRHLTDFLIRLLSGLLIVMSLSVSVPLTISTWQNGGGPWGFGIVGLPILFPLSGYLLFAVAGLARQPVRQSELFVGAHVVTVVIGLISFAIFPAYPPVLLVVPVLLAAVAFVARRHYRFLLLLMIVSALVANALLLKWELDFGRTIPLLQLVAAVI